MASAFPHIAFGTPRKLPKASSLPGRVVVLDIAFASNAGGASFEKITKPFIDGLGPRLAMWIDHHDHVLHETYRVDPRFVLATKAVHGACPEMVTPERVNFAGAIDTICCHTDFDGLCSAAKWILGGEEPYEGADADAHAIDTRLGKPGPLADTIDRAIRAKPNNDALNGIIVRFLAGRAKDSGLFEPIENAAAEFRAKEDESRRLAAGFVVEKGVAFVDVKERLRAYDKTLLLLLGQERARISVVADETAVTAAAAFESGVDLLAALGLSGGMPTRVSVTRKELDHVLTVLRTLGK
jgi:hypothetical protein